MRSKIDEKLSAGKRGTRPKPVKGGKALQRLFFYLGVRDPRMTEELLATIPVETSVRPEFGLTAKARRAPVAHAKGRRKTGRAAPTTRPFAAAIVKAATQLSRQRGRRPAARGMAGVAPAPPVPVGPNAWKPLGPFVIPQGQTYGTARVDVSGRVSSIAIDPGNANHILCGAAGGGIWETSDAGITWNVRTDAMPSLAIGAIAFDPSNRRTVYAGSGEGNFYFNLGAGLYRSTNGGTTWRVRASAPFVGVGFYDLVVDPARPRVLYAATTTGFYASTNSGSSWSLKRGGPCWDISLDPGGGAAAEILATFADGLFVSTNTGGTFSAVSLPSAPASFVRLAVDRVAASPDVAYVFGSDGNQAHLWRRAGTTWTKIAPLPAMNVTQAWYDWYVAATPNTPGQVFLGAIDTLRGDLSGSTWKWTNITTQGVNSIHPDQHCLAFAPGASRTIYAGNDGGLYRSANSGKTWRARNKGLAITEMEYLGSDPRTSSWLMSGTQDNGTIRLKNAPAWQHIADGDGGDCGVNPLNPAEVYHSFYRVSLERSINKGITWTRLAPPSVGSFFYPPVEVFGTTVGIGGVSLVISRDRGTTWSTVGLGLAAGDAASAMDIPDANTVLIGTHLGRVVRLTWSGASWSATTLTSPAARHISCILVDPGVPQRFWVTISQIGGPLVYRSDNMGSTWVNCSSGLPAIPMNSVAVDHANTSHLWVAGDVGVYESVNLGGAWTSFSNGLPNAVAADLIFHKKDRILMCATRNRGAWIIAVP